MRKKTIKIGITIPLEHGRRLQKAAPESANLWIVLGKGHSDCHLHPEF
jgi:hypothetical protein